MTREGKDSGRSKARLGEQERGLSYPTRYEGLLSRPDIYCDRKMCPICYEVGKHHWSCPMREYLRFKRRPGR